MTENTENSAVELDTNLSAEDLARADLYGLLALLFYAAPTQELLEKIAGFGQDTDTEQPDKNSLLYGPWSDLVKHAQESQPQDWAVEYENVFIGVGKQEIFLYGSYYLAGFLNEKPLVALRKDLQSMGLQAADVITETEDHVACLCEVMRYLIAGEDLAICNLTQQSLFFNQHIRPWSRELFEVLKHHPQLQHYQYVGALAGMFFEIEGQAFDML